jgi:hypothetical protein
LFLEGAQGGIVFTQLEGSTSGTRPNVLDVYYSFPISKFITFTPGFYIVSNPNGGAGTLFADPSGGTTRNQNLVAFPNRLVPATNDPSIIVGALRATFKF